MKRKHNPQDWHERLKKAKGLGGGHHFDLNPSQEVKVQIRPNKDVSLGMFKPDPLIPGGYIAHPTTIRAMRKDIFVAGSDEFIDLEEIIICQGCQKNVDYQFWRFCPYCEATLSQSNPS